MVIAVVALLLVTVGFVGATQFSSGLFSSNDLSIGVIAEPEDLDVRDTEGVPLDQILIDNVYQGLVGLQSGSVDDIVPVLATELPEVSDDGLSYTFTLRDGVRFHSGERLTTSDVVASLRETLTPELVGSDVTVSQ
ncbi:MAG: ABC transporter substrate-binding protein, partial [Leucobacter sp.]